MKKQQTKILETENTSDKLSVGFEAGVSLRAKLLNKIHLGDSFEFLEGCPPNVFDLILEDMPYNTTACDWDVKIDLERYWATRLRVLKPTGVVVLTASQPFTTDVIVSNRRMFKYEWIWAKTRPANFMSGEDRPLKYHENILMFYDKNKYNPIMRDGEKNHKSKPAKGNHNIYGIKGGMSDVNVSTVKYPSSIIEIKSTDSTQNIHPTQKPVGLFEYLIRTYTNENDLVFDGFGGSGTTAIAAYRSKRNFIVVEKEPKYFELSQKRLAEEVKQCRLF